MKHSMMVLPLTLCFVTACGGSSSTTPPADDISKVNTCGAPFQLARELGDVALTSSHWFSNKESNPKLTIAANQYDLNASQTLATSDLTCIHTANVLGSISPDTWQGDNELYVNKGGLFSYNPVVTLHFKQPDFDSYQDWQNAGSPSTVDAVFEQSNFAIWYQKSFQTRFVLADETEYLKTLPLQCSGFPFKLSLTTESYAAEDIQSLDLNYCDSQLVNGDVLYNCLVAALEPQSISGKCDFNKVNIALPDNKGDYQAIKISGSIELNETQPTSLVIDGVSF